MKKWLKAAARYEAAKKPGFKARKKRERKAKVIPSLETFMASAEGDAAKKLLAAAGTYILLGESEECMSQTTSVALDGNGLVRSHQVVGLAAAFTEQKPRQESVNVTEALKLLHSFPTENVLGEVDVYIHENLFVITLRHQLDGIAEDTPYGSVAR